MEITRTAFPPRTIIGIREHDTNPGELFASAVPELFAFAGEHGLQPAGPLIGLYYDVDDGSFDMAVVIPIAGDAEGTDRVFVDTLEAEAAMTTEHVGPYDGLTESWTAFMDQMKDDGNEYRMPCWEEYHRGPETDPNPATWQTTLVQPLA